MSDIKDGGPAFPNTVKITNEDFAELRGMTLRDYFAGQYLAGISSHPTVEGSMDEMAKWAYQMADAMLEAREVKP